MRISDWSSDVCSSDLFGSHTDWEWIEAAADAIKRAVLTTLLVPGIGTVEELRRAYALGVRSVRVATHCTEADVAKQHIGIARDLGMDVSGFLDRKSTRLNSSH